MSKKEQKLKKNLYKALTEYFIHNAKNSLSSSESILDQLASFRMETGLPAALKQDKKYQKAQKNCNKTNEKMQNLNLTPQQWDAIDAAITTENIASINMSVLLISKESLMRFLFYEKLFNISMLI